MVWNLWMQEKTRAVSEPIILFRSSDWYFFIFFFLRYVKRYYFLDIYRGMDSLKIFTTDFFLLKKKKSILKKTRIKEI